MTGLLVSTLHADTAKERLNLDEEQLNEENLDALTEWVESKKQISLKDLGGKLSISGEIRNEVQLIREKVDGKEQRGPKGVHSDVPSNSVDVEVNLTLDYRTDKTWSFFKLKFDNSAGAVFVTKDKLSLEQAIFGVRVLDRDTFTVDVEAGRRSLGYVFDSKVQFATFMDGMVVKYDHALPPIGDLFVRSGPFVIDQKKNQFGYVGEVALLNLFKTGFYSKFSFINWDMKKMKKEVDKRRYRFQNAQATIGYKFDPSWINKTVTLYGAGLINCAAEKLDVTNGGKENRAWYTGFSIGKAKKKGDWSFDASYQFVQMQAVPEFDSLRGIGRGNAAKIGTYSSRALGKGDLFTKSSEPVGNTNYKGWMAEMLYLLTDNITVYQSWKHSVEANKKIGPPFVFKHYEIEFIYAF